MLVLLLVRRLGPGGRKVTALVLFALAAAVAAVSAALSVNLYVHAVILAVLGAVILWAPVGGRGRRDREPGRVDGAPVRDDRLRSAPAGQPAAGDRAGTMEGMARKAAR